MPENENQGTTKRNNYKELQKVYHSKELDFVTQNYETRLLKEQTEFQNLLHNETLNEIRQKGANFRL